jgi:hypothetical protein
MKNIITVLAFTLALFTASAHADWQADLKIQTEQRQMTGQARGRQGAMRMDMDTPQGKVSMITDWTKKKIWSLMHGQKIVMELNPSQAQVDIPKCAGGNDIDACLTAEGFKKTGSETVNGHACAVYQKDKVKLWRPTATKEVPFVRSSTSEGGKVTAQVDFINAKAAPQDASQFSPPKDYASMGGLPDMMSGMKQPGGMPGGVDMENMKREMMQKYGGGGGQ